MTRIRSLFLCAVLCFCTGLLACLIQYSLSTAKGETNLALVFDSGHYQETARLLVAACQKSNDEKQDLAKALMLDGPILPGLAALALLSVGRLFALGDWQCLLGLQAFLHAVSAVLVYLVGRQFFSPSNKWALAAGLLWAVNPIAVLSTQRFLSENLTTVLLLTLILLSCRLIRTSSWQLLALSLASGFIAALILFAKTGLAPTAVLVLATAGAMGVKGSRQPLEGGSKGSRAFKIVLLLIGLSLGACFVIAPWAIYTKSATGVAQYFPQRAPVLNLFVGWNLDNDGLSTLPVAPVSKSLQKIYDKTGSAPQAVLNLWRHEPAASSLLALRKIGRLYGLPWNDFRRSCLFFSPKVQQWLYQVTMLLSVISACFAVGMGAPIVFWLSLLMISGHGIFLLFEAVPRYAYSSYPFIFLLALYLVRPLAATTWTRKEAVGCLLSGILLLGMVYGRVPQSWFLSHQSLDSASAFEAFYILTLLLQLLAPLLLLIQVHFLRRPQSGQPATGQWRRCIIALACAALFYANMCTWLAVYDYERPEWQSKIDRGQTAERIFALHTKIHKPAFALMLFDGTRQFGASEISINGILLKDKPVNLFDYFPDRAVHYLFAEQVAAFMGRSPSDIRRWWAVPVPLEALNFKPPGANTVDLKVPANAMVRLFGEYPAKSYDAPSNRPGFLYISPGKIWTSNDSFEWRQGRPFSTRPIFGESSLIGVDGKKVKQKGQWRMILLIGADSNIAQDLEASAHEPGGSIEVY
jgi:hypothetical protein